MRSSRRMVPTTPRRVGPWIKSNAGDYEETRSPAHALRWASPPLTCWGRRGNLGTDLPQRQRRQQRQKLKLTKLGRAWATPGTSGSSHRGSIALTLTTGRDGDSTDGLTSGSVRSWSFSFGEGAGAIAPLLTGANTTTDGALAGPLGVPWIYQQGAAWGRLFIRELF